MGFLDWVAPMVTYPTKGAIALGQWAGGQAGIGGGDDPLGIKQANDKNDQVRNANLGFGSQLAGDATSLTPQLAEQRGYLQDIQNGKISLSSEQLRQGLQQQLAQQRSMAAGANPANSSMAALNAANNMGRASYGMSGQAATAGIQERNAAAQQLGQLLLGQRGQDIGGATSAYGNAAGNPFQSLLQQYAPVLQAAGAGAGILASDRRLKKDIKDGGKEASRAIAKLPGAYVFKYKDKKYGKGKQIGVMAQDLEKAGLDHAVIDTPAGKMVHGAKLSAANTAMIAELGKRLSAVEKGGRK